MTVSLSATRKVAVSSSSRVILIINKLLIPMEFAYLISVNSVISGNHIQQNSCNKCWFSINAVCIFIKKEALRSKPNCYVKFNNSNLQEDKTLATLFSVGGNWTLKSESGCHLEEKEDTITILCLWPTATFGLNDSNDIWFNCDTHHLIDLLTCDMVPTTTLPYDLLTCDMVPTTTLPYDEGSLSGYANAGIVVPVFIVYAIIIILTSYWNYQVKKADANSDNPEKTDPERNNLDDPDMMWM